MTINCGTCRADPCSCDRVKALVAAADDYAAIRAREAELKAERENLVKMADLKAKIEDDLVDDDHHVSATVSTAKPGHHGIFDVGTPKLPEGRRTQQLSDPALVVVPNADPKKGPLGERTYEQRGARPSDVYDKLKKLSVLVIPGPDWQIVGVADTKTGQSIAVGIRSSDRQLKAWNRWTMEAFAGAVLAEHTTIRHIDTIVGLAMASCPGTEIVDVTQPGWRNGNDEPVSYKTGDSLTVRLSEQEQEDVDELTRKLHAEHDKHLERQRQALLGEQGDKLYELARQQQSDPGDENDWTEAMRMDAEPFMTETTAFDNISGDESLRYLALQEAIKLAPATSSTGIITAYAARFYHFLMTGKPS